MKRKTPFILFSMVILVIIAVVVGIVISRSGNQPHDHSTHDHGQEQAANNNNTSQESVATDKVEIINYAYNPATITVKVGTTVTWTNQDSVMHTVTTEDGAPASFDSGNFGRGESYSFTFDKPGTYNYYCIPHPYMKGTVIVTE